MPFGTVLGVFTVIVLMRERNDATATTKARKERRGLAD